MDVSLVRPTLALKEQALKFKQEYFDFGEEIINGGELLDCTDSYETWLVSVENNTNPETVNPEWVVTDTFFAIDNATGEIVGIIDLRHTLNDYLADLGNCGLSVRPSERQKGYATEILRQLLIVARQAGLTEIHLSVEMDNFSSINVIKKNGGVYARSFAFQGDLADIYRIGL